MGQIRCLPCGQFKTILRKVFRDGLRFRCGICRTDYSSKARANSCMNRCWRDVKREYPLCAQKFSKDDIQFRCRFCGRTYEDEESGLACAHRCIKKNNKLHSIEQVILDLPYEKPQYNFKRSLSAMDQQFVSRFNLRRRQEEEEKAKQEAAAEEAKANAEAAEASATEAKAAEEVKRLHKSSWKKDFIRKDAKYLCMYCNEEHWTKVEVKNCFESHFDDTGHEIDPGKAFNRPDVA